MACFTAETSAPMCVSGASALSRGAGSGSAAMGLPVPRDPPSVNATQHSRLHGTIFLGRSLGGGGPMLRECFGAQVGPGVFRLWL